MLGGNNAREEASKMFINFRCLFPIIVKEEPKLKPPHVTCKGH